jgi:hypothetical protein
MCTIQQRLSLTGVVALLMLVLFASSGRQAFADVLFIGGSSKDDIKQEALAEKAQEPEELDKFLDALFVDEEFIDDDSTVKAPNPVAVLSTSIRERLDGMGSVMDITLRSLTHAAASENGQWTFPVAGLLFLMLMMRFRRRTKKSKF